MLKWHFLCFNLCPLLLCLSLDAIEKSLPKPSSIFSSGIALIRPFLEPMILSYALIRSFLPLFSRLNSPNYLSFPLYVRLSHPLIPFIPLHLLQCVHVTVGSTELGPAFKMSHQL